ncbi:hypothetical protein A5N15_00815 [Rothia kristinae]|uniref:Glycosyltransferase 2-like domain-containing protein n=1 Tax=Rothia kristinae TaxID=37923 RepID=A0A657IVY7_9MICC|nr:hypothetical protein A5N15_00815 [Rothia kristinae]
MGTWVETDTGRKLGPEYRTMGYLPYTHGSSRGMKRTVWDAIGGFDESFPTGHEEVDFDWRAQEAGFQLTTTTLASSWYVQRRTMRAVRKQRRAYALGWMLLWARFREGRPLPPISFAGSLRRYPEDLLKAVLTLRPTSTQLSVARAGSTSGGLRESSRGTGAIESPGGSLPVSWTIRSPAPRPVQERTHLSVLRRTL